MAEAVLRDVLRHLRRIWAAKACGDLTDGQLVDRFLHDRDDAAFTVLMQRHGPMVLGVCQRVAGDEHAAEDCFQGTFLVLARRAGSIRKKESVASWLYGVAEQIAVRAKTKTTLRRDRERRSMDMPSSQPLDELTWQELRDVLDQEISRLPEKYRAPIVLCYFEGKSHDKAAKELGWPKNSVTTRLGRGRELLRKQLVQRGITLSVGVLTTSLTEKVATASVTARLTLNTVQAAMSVTAGKAVAAGVLSANALALAEEAMSGIIGFKMKVVAVALMLGLAVGGAGLAGYGALAPGSEANPVKGEKPGVLRATETAVAQQAKQPDKVSLQKKEMPRVDLYGDALPDGAVMRLGTVQLRAAGASLAISADGKTLIGVRGGKYVSHWDVETGKLREKNVLPGEPSKKGPREPVNSLVSPDGRWLATWVDDERDSLKIWDIHAASLAHKLLVSDKGFRDFGTTQVFSPDGKLFASTWRREGTAGIVRVWNLESGNVVFAHEMNETDWIHVLRFTPDSKKLVFMSHVTKGGAHCWDLVTGQRLWQEQGFSWYWMNFTPDGRVFSSNQSLDLATGKRAEMDKLHPRGAWIAGTVTPDGEKLALSGIEDVTGIRGVQVWDIKHGKKLHLLAGEADQIVASPDSKTIITNNHGSIQRWDLATGKPLYPATFDDGHVNQVMGLVFSADGKRLASASVDGSVRLWNVGTGKPIHVWSKHQARLRVPHSNLSWAGVKTLDMTPDGRWIISAGSEGEIRTWDAVSGKEGIAIPLQKPNIEVGQIRISHDGAKAYSVHRAAAVDNKHTADWLATWDLRDGKLLAKHSVSWINRLSSAFSRDGRLLVNEGKVVQVTSGKTMCSLEGHPGVPYGSEHSYTPDGSLVVGGTVVVDKERLKDTGSVGVWESSTGKRISQLRTDSFAGLLAIHPSSRFVAVSNLAGIELWDFESEARITILNMPEEIPAWPSSGTFASSLAFTPDGRHLATGQPDGTILLWKLDLPAPKNIQLDGKELDSLWTELKDIDAARAWQAVWRLVDAPENAVPFLAKQLKPFQPAAAEVTAHLLADLASDTFAKREAANKQLKELGLSAETALKEQLKNNPTLEVRQRIDLLLKSLAESPPALTQDDLRNLRGVAVLARIQSPQASEILEGLAKGVESAPLTVAAKAAMAK